MTEQELKELLKELGITDCFTSLHFEKPMTPEKVINAVYLNFDLVERGHKNPWIANAYLFEKEIGITARATTAREAIIKLKSPIDLLRTVI